MKHASVFLLTVAVCSIAVPLPASALSCLDPDSSIEYYLSEENNAIFTAVAGEMVEHVTQEASSDGDPNRQYNEGYVGQLVSVSEVHKGSVESEKWVYYTTNSTWGYMCTNQPPEVGTTNVYIVNNGNGSFDLPSVVQVFAVDSDYAATLFAELSESDEEGYMYESTASNWLQDLEQTLREMATIVRIKLAEWQFWSKQ